MWYNFSMKVTKKYFSIIFIVATLLGVLHHHNDLRVHNDCQICILQSNITNGDTPQDVVYITPLEHFSEQILSKPKKLHVKTFYSNISSRAPPSV